jgi:hypothetical protein
MKTYKIKVSFKFKSQDHEEIHDMMLSSLNINRIREWLGNYYKVGPYDVSVYNYSEV